MCSSDPLVPLYTACLAAIKKVMRLRLTGSYTRKNTITCVLPYEDTLLLKIQQYCTTPNSRTLRRDVQHNMSLLASSSSMVRHSEDPMWSDTAGSMHLAASSPCPGCLDAAKLSCTTRYPGTHASLALTRTS